MLQQLTYNTRYLLKPKIIPTNAMALGYNKPYYYNYYYYVYSYYFKYKLR